MAHPAHAVSVPFVMSFASAADAAFIPMNQTLCASRDYLDRSPAQPHPPAKGQYTPDPLPCFSAQLQSMLTGNEGGSQR